MIMIATAVGFRKLDLEQTWAQPSGRFEPAKGILT